MSRRPHAVALVAAAAVLPWVAWTAGWDWYFDGLPLVLLAALTGYAAGTWFEVPAAAVVVAITVAVLVAVNQLQSAQYHWLDDLVFFLVIVGGPAAAGRVVTVRAEQVARLRGLADELGEQQRLAVAAARLEEQTRVQQQVHVGLTERVAAIAVRAEGARRVGDAASLEPLEAEARAVLDEVREVLGSLAAPGPGEPEPEADALPAPEPAPLPSRLDVVLVVVIGGAMAVEVLVHPLSRGPGWANVLVALLVSLPLVVRRARPRLAVGASLLVALPMTLWLTPVPATVTGVALLSVLVYSLGAWSRSRWWAVAWVAAAGGTLLLEQASWLADDGVDGDQDWLILVWLLVAVLLGRLTSGWQARARRTAETVAALEQGKDAATRLATARERQALASQLHDTLAHSMTVVCLQAAAGRRGGVELSETLGTIATTAATGVAELRDGLDAIASGDHPLDPSRLLAVGRRVGVDLSITDAPAPPVTGPAAALAYRVVREAVVNVARHAPGASAEVAVARRGEALRVEVTDCGGVAEPSGLGTGTGLTGLARAVEAAGGELAWGPGSARGFRVVATIPEVIA